ncbi:MULTISPECIES: type II toxin-antitoxin system RelE/ParE family toxin [Streptococcus]|uniref:type II toxin-antitoxin system RelE/ParE family toxin n=1 Tax=Streptococcus TaxID=1301 RepID=UPI000CF59364|nr:type II toxin-antitoxin system RelE/ParE family toxin [Streptococcus suis]MBM0194946.1 type II toxin-antitoxin system RelE/ParE family toxin [Streptococcus suis]MBM7316316.1 type II toxin-antitoxin system RelE/ParE family toxin [Streptococcus suis]HEM4694594.1 type II toxin-antitoxin system RelE/ParE family toxin [Streptococcus suis]HEM4858504.1 type II toxin-antitoxin system RelE/ParE family toxin [Streptococcus suis]HEM4896430.1 type II toxin-antitoxin system RelE/ParE family toxin [Strep
MRSYIREELKSPDAADKKIQVLIAGLRSLEIFPERGLNADERPLVPGQLTRGLPIKKDYIAIYNIDEAQKVVNVRYLVASKSDYMRLFK